jgi:hypothetical protein
VYVAEDDTMLNPYEQTATIFCDTDLGQGGACAIHETVENSLLAGGGFTLYPCANATSPGGTVVVKGNRFARCLGTPDFESSPYGGTKCTAKSRWPINEGADSHGYWPEGGYFGHVESLTDAASLEWEGNFWDNNLATVAD